MQLTIILTNLFLRFFLVFKLIFMYNPKWLNIIREEYGEINKYNIMLFNDSGSFNPGVTDQNKRISFGKSKI